MPSAWRPAERSGFSARYSITRPGGPREKDFLYLGTICGFSRHDYLIRNAARCSPKRERERESIKPTLDVLQLCEQFCLVTWPPNRLQKAFQGELESNSLPCIFMLAFKLVKWLHVDGISMESMQHAYIVHAWPRAHAGYNPPPTASPRRHQVRL